MEEMIIAVLAEFKKTGSIRKTARNFNLSTASIRKMLVTSGEWQNKTSTEIAVLHRNHPDWTKAQIAEQLKISTKAVEMYTPYEQHQDMWETRHSNIPNDGTTVDLGQCGVTVSWVLRKDGTLIVSGTGPMYDYSGDCWGVWGEWRPKWWQRRDGVQVLHIIVEEGVTSIGEYAFADLVDLQSVQMPDSLAEIHGGAFARENDMRVVCIPDGVKVISWDTFYQNFMMEEIHIPAGVFKIQTHAFHGCKGLKRMYFYGDAPRTAESSFAKCAEDVVIYHREGATGFGETWNGYRTEVF